MKTVFIIYLVVINILTYIIYAKDKKYAKQNKKRVKESILLIFTIIGGALGGYLAMIYTHHKTKKWYFVLINILGIVLYSYILYYLFTK